jgi:hypothetical protein
MAHPFQKEDQAMKCLSCQSTSQSMFPAELNIHFPGLEGLDKPTVWAFPQLLVCFDCGFTQFTLSSDQVRTLQSDLRSDAAAV